MRAIGILEKALDPDHPELAGRLANRANLLVTQVIHVGCWGCVVCSLTNAGVFFLLGARRFPMNRWKLS